MAGSPAWAGDGLDEWISPVTNPTNFEDPRATTDVRPIFVYHKIDNGFVTRGGDAYVAALQLRLALTERLAIIATKDGYVWLNPKDHLGGLTPDEDGWGNIAAGLKYSLLYDPEAKRVVTLGFRYEAPSGDEPVFQGNGDGFLNPFVSAGVSIGMVNLLGYVGPQIAISGKDTSKLNVSVHADVDTGAFYPLLEANWIQTFDGGRRLPIDQEGFDYFNLGSADAAGEGVVTLAVGGRYRALDDLSLMGDRKGGLDIGTAFEFPVTHKRDLFDWRVTTDLVFWIR
jgi:hypothetical protein